MIIGSSSLPAAPGQAVNGLVLDEQGGIPIGGASVRVLGTQKGAYTRNDGKFTILDVSGDNLKLLVTSIGYMSDTVDVGMAGSTFITIKLKGSVIEKGEVVVLSNSAKGQARALNQQKTNGNVSNIVSSDLIGRFPDQNVGDAMKRIPGIAVQYDQGEARFGLIRGTPGQLNSVMINGERIPSAEAEIRQVQLDLVPSEMVRAIEVNKTLTPDMDADAVGGSVNLVTRDAATETRLSATLGSGYNFLSERPMILGSFIATDRFLGDHLGLVLSGSYYDHMLGSDNKEATWGERKDGSAWLDEFEVRTYQVRRVRRSLSAGLDYRFDPNNVLRLNAIYNHRDDWENRFRLRYIFEEDADDVQIRRQTKAGPNGTPNNAARLEDQRTYNVTLGGEHNIGGALRLTWNGTYAKASEERPNERYVQYRNRDAKATVNLSDSTTPIIAITEGGDYANYKFHELTEEYQYTEDVDRNGRLDISFPWLTDEFSNVIKAGFRIRNKSKERKNNFFEYSFIDEEGNELITSQPLYNATKDNFLAGPYEAGEFVYHVAIGDYQLEDPAKFDKSDVPDEYAAGNFTAEETILAGYAMLDQKIGDNLQAIIGVRFENTSNTYNGNVFNIDDGTVQPAASTTSYLNILPSINLRFQASDDLILRGAWTNGLARPNYYDLVPYRSISFDDGELSVGNPDLKATTSMNFDLMAEYYMQPIGILSGGVFYKSLKNFIFNYIQNNYYDAVTQDTFEVYSQPRNLASAGLFGVELQLQRQLDFLPGALSGLGIFLNYTFTSSTVDGLPLEGRTTEDLRLSGSPQHSANASLSYEYGGLMLRVALNYTSDYIDEYGDGAFYDRYYDTQMFVDANASFAITPQFRIFVDANNLTNQPLQYYQGTPARMAQAEFYNARFQAGVKYDM
jgi:TonB-dependent receptor